MGDIKRIWFDEDNDSATWDDPQPPYAPFVRATDHEAQAAEQLQGAVEAVETALADPPPAPEPQVCQTSFARGWIAARRAALDALGEQYAAKEDASQPRWVVGGCYEENRLRLISGRALGVHEQLTLVEASE